MHPILEQFLDRWVWPTMPGAPGAEFRLRLTKEQCIKGWEISLQRTLGEIEEELGREDEAIVTLEAGGRLWVRTATRLAPGENVTVVFPADRVIFLPSEGVRGTA